MQPYEILISEKGLWYQIKEDQIVFPITREQFKVVYKLKTIILTIMQGILNAHTMDTNIKKRKLILPVENWYDWILAIRFPPFKNWKLVYKCSYKKLLTPQSNIHLNYILLSETLLPIHLNKSLSKRLWVLLASLHSNLI